MRKITLFCAFLLVTAFVQAQLPALERVEPSNWWVGMKNPRLQLLVHGDHIANRKVSLRWPGVHLQQIHSVQNPNYLFLDLSIDAGTKAGVFPIHFTSADGKDISYSYALKTRNHSTGRAQGVTSCDLVYLIMPDRFSNGDPSNDKVPGMRDMSLNRDSMYQRHGGDLQGIIDHLDYLKDLGVTAVWCTPEIVNDMPRASYHGYAVTDHYRIDPRYGTNELYKKFVDSCHAMGLKVIKDVVHNHSGSDHWILLDPPMKDWVHEWPSYTQTTYKDQTVMDPYGAPSDRKKMLDGWFVRSMPDMNESNPYVQHYLTQNHIWWVEYAGIDGLRLDTYPYNDPVYMSQWAKDIQAEFPHLSIFGETLVANTINQAFFTQGNTVHRGLDTHLPGITDVQVKESIYESLNGDFGWSSGVNRLYTTLADDFVYEDATRNLIFLDNHDMSRFFSMVKEDLGKFKSGIALLLTLRGIPQIYYGTEILMKNFSNPDGKVREDFPGGWKGDRANKFIESGRSATENEAFNWIRTLARYRRSNAVLQTGRLMQYVPENGIYVYFRYNAEKTVMVTFNSTKKDAHVRTARFEERMKDLHTAMDVMTGERLPAVDDISVPPGAVRILELHP